MLITLCLAGYFTNFFTQIEATTSPNIFLSVSVAIFSNSMSNNNLIYE
jgi:hypothetical protein